MAVTKKPLGAVLRILVVEVAEVSLPAATSEVGIDPGLTTFAVLRWNQERIAEVRAPDPPKNKVFGAHRLTPGALHPHHMADDGRQLTTW
ncbi:MAG: hypothetical protein ACYCTE_10145 [Acidimicrobiales bacterium]